MHVVAAVLLLAPCNGLAILRPIAPLRSIGHPAVSPTMQLFARRPPPPPPPALIDRPATQVICRDGLAYALSFLAVAAVPLVDWTAIGGPLGKNAARIVYFAGVGIASVYLGAQRQDIGETAPIAGRQAALAPVFASLTLGGLYLLITKFGIDPSLLYRSAACLLGLQRVYRTLAPLVFAPHIAMG